MDKKLLVGAGGIFIALVAALGFTSPRSQIESIKGEVKEVQADVKILEGRASDQDTKIAVQKEQLLYLMDGIDDLRGLSSEERKALRRSRRGIPN